MVRHRYWIVDILCDPKTETKIWKKHRVTYQMVCEAVRLGSYEQAHWKETKKDRRLFVFGRTSAGTRLLVILRPVDIDDGRWRLASAWEMNKK